MPVTSNQKKGDDHYDCIDETNLTICGFTGPAELDGSHGHHGHDRGGIFIES
jgi:hypothetical protein